MNKLTLVSMAILCLLFTACNVSDEDYTSNSLTLLETRSADPITVSFIDLQGTVISFQCTDAVVDYYDGSTISLELAFGDNTSYSGTGNDILFSVLPSHTLEITADNGNNFESSDLEIEVCDQQLCYSTSVGALSGTALSFIVGDDAIGF